MSTFSSLLKKSTSLDSLKSAVSNVGAKKTYDDVGYYKLTPDKAGNASAIIRFLPAPPPETIPFSSFYRHAFEGPNGWYIENSRTSLNEPDPLSDYNSRLWATKDDAFQTQARKQARKSTFVANIYVIQDKANPEAEGKVFLYRFGPKIFEKIKKALQPDFPEDPAFDPFHVIEGANFRLRQKRQSNFPNYDDSSFDSCKPLLNGDEKALNVVFKELKPIAVLTAPDKFKSYEELKKRLDKVMGFDTSVYLTPAQASADSGMRVGAPSASAPVNAKPVAAVATKWVPPTLGSSDDEVDEDTAARLAQFDDDKE